MAICKGKADLLPELVAELVHLKVDVIIASATQAIQAAKQATTTIPIVFPAAGDPVAYGLVASLARPGGNITGLTILAPELSGKRLELLKEAFPGIGRVAPSSMTRVYRNRSKKRRPQASSWESRFNRWKSEMLPMSSLHSQQ